MKTTIEHTGFGLIAWLESTRVRLPLKGVECRFEITSGIASVEIDQIYFQENAAPLDCTYSFPLPAGAAVYRCEVDINGRLIRAIVEEKMAARQIFAEQKAKGHRAALVESERDNLFTLQLGNVQPQDVVVVRFAYLQTIERGAGEQRRLRIPVCPGVRYIPGQPLLRSPRGKGTVQDTDQVPDASRLSPPRIEQLHPDAAYCAISGTLPLTDAAEDLLASPTHPTRAKLASGNWSVQLDDHGAVPDRDFVLTWAPPATQTFTPRAWAARHGGSTYALVQLRAPEAVAVAEDFEQDFYFLVDRSGSMSGAKWTKTCEALTAFVRLLGRRDRVWITLFESTFRDFAEEPLPAQQVRDDQAFQALVKLGTGGGTELLPAANHVLGKLRTCSADRRSVILLITDGQVGNEAAVQRAFAQSPDTTVFTFGIDTAVNDAFLRALAAQHGGTSVLQTPKDDIAATVSGLAEHLRRPVVTNLRVDGGWTPAKTPLPALFGGQTIDLVLQCEGEGTTVDIHGRRADGQSASWHLPLALVTSDAPRLLWAREKIATLEAAGEDAAALALAKTHNLLCKSAAFLAWDEAEKVKVATQELYQPSMDNVAVAACAVAAAPRELSLGLSPGLGKMRASFSDHILYQLSEPPQKRGAGKSGGFWSRLAAKLRGGGSADIEIADGVTLPRQIAKILLLWEHTHEDRGDLLLAYQALLAILRLYSPCSNETADATRERLGKIRKLLSDFARTHMDYDERSQLEAELHAWAKAQPSA